MDTLSDFETSQLITYLEGRSTPADRDAIERWIGDNPERRAALIRLIHVWRVAGQTSTHTWDSDEMWQRVAQNRHGAHVAPFDGARAHRPATVSHNLSHNLSHNARPRRIVAGVLAALLGAAAIVTVATRTRPTQSDTTSVTTFATVGGERKEVTLRDGTRVVLAPQSRVTLARSFSSQTRDITLDGEAHFVVTQAAGTPFTVRANGAITRVLGTAFTVRRYAGDSTTRITVSAGRVNVRRADSESSPGAILERGDVAQSTASGITVERNTDIAADTAWLAGRFVFDDVPLSTVMTRLERWYGVTITLADPSLAHRRITATLNIGTLTSVLDLITTPLDIHYTREGTNVVLR